MGRAPGIRLYVFILKILRCIIKYIRSETIFDGKKKVRNKGER